MLTISDEECWAFTQRYGGPPCRDCGEPIIGASWNRRCLDCHEAHLLPVPPGGLADTGERWEDIYVGRHSDGW